MYYTQAWDKLHELDKLSHTLYYLQGNDLYFNEDILKEILKYFKSSQIIYCKPIEKEVIQAIKYSDFLENEFCVIVDNINKLDGFMGLLEHIKKKDFTNKLILKSPIEPEVTKDSVQDVFFKELRKRSFYIDCLPISIFNDVRLLSLIKYFFKRAGSTLEDDAANLFLANTDMSDLRIVNNEAHRVSTMFLGQVISSSMLIKVLNKNVKQRLAVLISYIALRDLVNSVKITHTLLLEGCSVQTIIDYIYKFFKTVIILINYLTNNKFITEEVIGKNLNIPLPMVPNYVKAAKYYNIRRVYNVLQQLRLATVNLHKGLPKEYVVENMIYKICKK